MSRAGPPIAHSRNPAGERHLLLDHIGVVTEMATRFAEVFGAAELARWAGIWHDLGKFHPEFQQYLIDVDAPDSRRRRGPDHKAAGASLAGRHGGPLAHLIAGHHGGLRDEQAWLRPWLNEHMRSKRVAEALAIAREYLPAIEPVDPVQPPAWVRSPHTTEMFLRMVFSTLVDADFLDTEAHFDPERSAGRGDTPSVAALADEMERARSAISGRDTDAVNVARHEVYLDCLRAAASEPGFFTLTVPTGGGKTLSSLAFALRHAATHGLERVIVAIPYTSITDQTAEAYRGVFAHPRAVLEHHSAIEREDDEESQDTVWERLAAENWDAPIVVTTTVQLFESLLGARTGACRKLHNIARSVIVLDEAQTLPEHLLEPILDVLRELVAHYGVSVVLCTATQPALRENESFRGLPDVREIASDPEGLFARLRRVEYEWAGAGGATWTWERAAEEMRGSDQALAIVNTRANALALLDALDDPDALHLSTLLCGAHRRDVLATVRRRLDAGEPCRLIATQVVEAGVDIDFPLVLRALGPLDRIVQAAGRCNRAGRLERGRTVIFQPDEGSAPRGAYQTGIDLTAIMLAGDDLDFHNPAVYEEYFQRLHARVNLDVRDIQPARARFEFETVARRFRMIDEAGVPVLCPYWRGTEREGVVVDALDGLRNRRGNPRLLWRALQPYTVNVRQHAAQEHERNGLLVEVIPGLWEWRGGYDQVRGLEETGLAPQHLMV